MKEIARHLILAFLTTLALGGCGKAPEPKAGQGATPTPAATATASPSSTAAGESAGDSEKNLNIFCWSEYIPQGIVDAFTKETGIKVSIETYASNEEMLAKLFAGGGAYDLIQPSEYVIEGLIKEDMLTPIDHQAIPNMKNLAPEFTSMSFDPGNKYSVPYMAGTVGIVVNTELVQDEIKGYNDVFQEKF
ncbi:MAG TPA: extracellular solute-binding protein, partial [Terrimicrobiaceae bacterium]|nr:extracellular solute-binding protein [Terrimicrobiaceae bacterium]